MIAAVNTASARGGCGRCSRIGKPPGNKGRGWILSCRDVCPGRLRLVDDRGGLVVRRR